MYHYPDRDDLITARGLESSEPYKGYWEKSERRIFNVIKATVGEELQRPDTWLMDAGSGWGRLLPVFGPLFDRVIAVEPDPERLQRAIETANQNGLAKKTFFVRSQIQEILWPGESIDAIICSHIIQHVHTDLAPEILSKFRDLLKEDGILFLTTSHSTALRDFFAAGRLDGEKVSFSLSDLEEFNRLAMSRGDGLPVRFFTIDSVKRLLEEAGFAPIDVRVFQIMKRSAFLKALDIIYDRDPVANSVSFLRERLGTNMYIYARKRS